MSYEVLLQRTCLSACGNRTTESIAMTFEDSLENFKEEFIFLFKAYLKDTENKEEFGKAARQFCLDYDFFHSE
jgi:hypothetical protein